MITLITGSIGSGKTLHAVKHIPEYLQEYDLIFHNIEGLKQYFYWTRKASRLRKLDFSFTQWEELINFIMEYNRNSIKMLFLIDEASFYFPNSRKAFPRKDFIDFLAYSRHYGVDFLLIAQNPAQLHYQVRHLINKHIHIRRRHGTGMLNILEKEGLIYEVSNPVALRRQCTAGDILISRAFLDKRFYDAYQSQQVPVLTQQKKKIPIKIKLWIAFLGIMPFFIYLMLISTIRIFK